MAKYVITYTNDVLQELDDDFTVLQILAHSQNDADLIIHNIESIFKGVTVELVEIDSSPQKRKRVNSDQRKK